MPSWDIDPAAVRGVLSRTESVASAFEGQLTRLNTELQGAMTQSSSGIVAGAMADFADAQLASIRFVFARTGAAIGGAAQASNAYVEGDLQMAVDAQASASAAPQPRAVLPGGGATVPG